MAALEAEHFSLPWSEEAFRSALAGGHGIFVVCESDHSVIGYAGAYLVCGEAEVTNVCVDAKYRNRGCGRALMACLESELKKLQCVSILLEVRRSNAAAIACYRACGWEEIGVRKNFYERPLEDAVIMTKNV